MWLKFTGWLFRLLGGLLPIGVKPFGEYIGKLVWAICIFAACTFALRWLFPEKPHATTIAAGGTQIINQAPQDVAHIGCNMWRGYIRLGVTK